MNNEDLKRIEQFQMVDIFKFICAILVVSYHVQPWRYFDGIVAEVCNAISNTGVVYFFIISGFLLGRKTEFANFNNAIKKQIKRLVTLWIIWEVIYIPFIFLGGGFYKSIIKTLLKNFVLGSYGHLWYLRASAVGLVIIYCFLKKKQFKLLYVFSGFCLAIGLYGINIYSSSNSTIIESVIDFCNIFRSGIFFGLPCITIGIIISRCEDIIMQINFKVMFGLNAIAFTLYLLEFQKYNGQLTLFLIIFITLFVLLITQVKFSFNFSTEGLRKMSTMIYLIHYAVFCVVSHTVRGGWQINIVVQFFVVLFITIAISLIFLFASKKYGILKCLF